MDDSRRAPADGPDLVIDGRGLVRLALEAQLDAFGRRRGADTGRQALGRRLGVGAGTLTERMHGRPDQLWELAVMAEASGIAELGSVTRLARQQGLLEATSPRLALSALWWKPLASASTTGSGSGVTFRAPIDAVFTGEALLAHLSSLGGAASARRVLSAAEYETARSVLTTLGSLACGPFGIGFDALDLVARLAPIDPDELAAMVGRSPVGSKLIRSVDRSLRLHYADSAVRQAAQTILATPPTFIYSKTLWIRGLRRVLLSDIRRGLRLKQWVSSQLMNAAMGEGSYLLATDLERRYAYFVLLELAATYPDRDVTRFLELHSLNPVWSDLYELREMVWRHLGRQPAGQRDLFYARLEHLVPDHIRSLCERRFDPDRLLRLRSSDRDVWGWARRHSRTSLLSLVQEGSLTPCAVRYRSCVDTIRSAGPAAIDSCAAETGVLLEEVLAHSKSGHLAERLCHLLGLLHAEQSIPIIEDILRSQDASSGLAKVAMIAAGHLTYAFPTKAAGLLAWSAEVAARLNTDESAAYLIHSFTVGGRDPKTHVARCRIGEVSLAMMSWSADVLGSTMLPARIVNLR